MPLSVHEIVVPVMIDGIGVMDDYINHAARLAAAKKLPVPEIFGARLAPDMLSLADQIAVLCNKVGAHVAKLGRRVAPAPVNLVPTTATLKVRIADTVRYLNGLEPEDLAGAENHT